MWKWTFFFKIKVLCKVFGRGWPLTTFYTASLGDMLRISGLFSGWLPWLTGTSEENRTEQCWLFLTGSCLVWEQAAAIGFFVTRWAGHMGLCGIVLSAVTSHWQDNLAKFPWVTKEEVRYEWLQHTQKQTNRETWSLPPLCLSSSTHIHTQDSSWQIALSYRVELHLEV